MKSWTIDEFVAECENLCRNQYTYNYDNMPDGICNGHTVGAYKGLWCSVVVDNCICTMGVIDERWPNGFGMWIVGDKEMTNLEYVRYCLEQ